MRRSGSSDCPVKRSRTRSGCTVCRARKVKCDERTPFCLNCERLQLDCPGYGSGSGAAIRAERADSAAWNEPGPLSTTEAGTKRRRTYRSCKACRSYKTRCSGERPVCTRCAQKNLDCIYSSGPSPAWVYAISPQSLFGREPERQDSMGVNQEEAPPRVPSPLSEEQNYHHQFEEAYKLRETNSSDETLNGKNSESTPHSLSWITSPQLPSKENIRCLVDEYFANVHPLRCYGFIHKPSFMQRLDEGLSANHTGNALLYTICALGAKFFVLKFSNAVESVPSAFILSAGNNWAKKAKDLIFADLGEISIENLMASVLLYDHDIRTGSYASAFMLSATSARMAQALQVNLEHSADVLCAQPSQTISICSKEARRRLMWACYIMDSWVGSGVDQLTILDEKDIKIQLPCHSRNFLLQIPCITETIERGKVLDFLIEDLIPENPAENMGMMAYFIRLVELRKKVLRYVKHLDTATSPWLPNSELSVLAAGFQDWRGTLPASMHFLPTAIYTRKESLELGALALVWCTYHQTLCDLYRIGMPILFKIRTPIEFPSGQGEFLQHCQQTCFESAKNVSLVISGAMKHSINMLADTWMCTIAYDSTRVMLYYLTQLLDSSKEQTRLLLRDTIPLLQSNVKALRLMIPMFATAEHCYNSGAGMLRRAGLDPQTFNESRAPEGPSHPNDIEGPSIPGSPVQMTPEYFLNPLAIYRMARRSVQEKHAPEESTSPLSSTASSREVQLPQQPQVEYITHQPLIQVRSMHNAQRDEVLYHQVVPQNNFDGPQIFSGFEFGGSWQPPVTAMDGVEWGGLPPWATGVLGTTGADPALESNFDFQSPFFPLPQLPPS